MLRYLHNETISTNSEISHSSSELAFYHHMAESTNFELQKQILREAEVTRCVLKSRRKLDSPTICNEDRSVPPRFANS